MDHLPEEIRAGLAAAATRAARKTRRLRVRDGERVFPVLRQWDGGFAMEEERAAHLRGLVDLLDGDRLLKRCLIVASRLDGREVVFEYKHATPPADSPPLDYERPDDAPVGLLPR